MRLLLGRAPFNFRYLKFWHLPVSWVNRKSGSFRPETNRKERSVGDSKVDDVQEETTRQADGLS